MHGATAGRWIVRVGIALGGIIAVLIAAMVLLLQTGAVSRRVKDMVLPRASAALGREVTVQGAKLRLLPGPRVVLTQAAIAGRPGEPPLVELQALEISLRFWPLVRSLGKDVEVAAIRLLKPTINLVRAPDGTWNATGLGKSAGASAAAAPGGVSAGERRKVVVSHAAIDDGSVRIVDRAAGSTEATVAISHIQLSADHVGLGEPLDATLSAALAGPEPNLHAQIHADRLPATVTALGPGDHPRLTGTLALIGLDLARLRDFLPASFTGMMTGGRVDVSAQLSTRGDVYLVDGRGKLGAVRLRGEPAEGGFALHAAVDPGKGALHATVEEIALKGPGVDLGGVATIDAMPLRIRFAISGPLLDLGQVLGLLPPSAPKPSGAPPLTGAQRRSVQTLDVSGTLDIAKVVKGPLVATELKAGVALDRSAFLLHDAGARLFGGRVDASGTRMDLAPAVPTWDLQARLEGVDLGQALTALAGAAPVVGKVNGAVALAGAGVDWPNLRKELTGHGALALSDGALTTADLGNDVLGAVARGLRSAGKGTAAGTASGAAGKTPLHDLAVQFTVKDGAMTSSRPLAFAAPFGTGSLHGQIGLDGALGLDGDVIVSRQALAGALGPLAGAAPASLRIPVSLRGTLTHPSVNVDAQQVIAELVSGAVSGGAQQQLRDLLKDPTKGAAPKGLGDILKRLEGK